jgi:4'-phosphopantetheinyl transferase EntD
MRRSIGAGELATDSPCATFPSPGGRGWRAAPEGRGSSPFEALLPPGAVVVEATPAMWDGGLWPEEAALVRSAVAERRREFTAGRNCARATLRALGIAEVAIPVGAGRAPRFPGDVSGSITHAGAYCAAAAIHRGPVASIGIDAESIAPLPSALVAMILSARERAAFTDHAVAPYDLAKLAFSAKEAFYKAWYPLTGVMLEFRDVAIALDCERGQYTIGSSRYVLPWRCVGRFAVDGQRFYCAVAIPER